MTRMRLVMTFITITAFYVIWNMFHPGTPMPADDYYSQPHSASALHIPLLVYITMMVLGYLLNWINIVNEWERRPVMLFGRYVRTLGPGISFVEPIIHNVLGDVSVQDLVIEVPVANVQTKDNVGIAMVGVLTYRIAESRVKDSVVEVDNVDTATFQRALSTLTDVAAISDLDRLLEHRDEFCVSILTKLADRVKDWGVTVKAFELKAFSINDEAIEQAIAMKARAAKEGAAELVRAEMQKKIAEALNEAAKTYDADGKWLKELETTLELCRSAQNNTILIPSNLISGALAQMAAKVAG